MAFIAISEDTLAVLFVPEIAVADVRPISPFPEIVVILIIQSDQVFDTILCIFTYKDTQSRLITRG